MRTGFPCVCALTITLAASGAAAAVLNVGPDQKYTLPSQAIKAATAGDIIRIAPGTYRDCAAWSKPGLTIEGAGDGAVLADAICQGKGIFVVSAPDAVVRNVTFEGAAIDEGNGAGIRADGASLTVEHCTFRENQDGILTSNLPGATLTIRDSTFEGNGTCLPNKGCAHGIYVGHIALAHIENSHFLATRTGHHVKSRAKRTELVGNTIEDGPQGTSSYLVDIPNGGSLLMAGNTLEKGPRTQNPTAAVSIGEEGGNRPNSEIVIKANTFTNDGPPTVFVHNASKTPAQLSGNVVNGPARLLVGPGSAD